MKKMRRITSMVVTIAMITSLGAFNTTVQASSFDYPRTVKVICLPGIDQDRMMSIVNTLPQHSWTFTLSPTAIENVDWHVHSDSYGTRPFPITEDDSMVVANLSDFPDPAGIGECFWGPDYTYSYSILKDVNDSDETIRQRMWHELCHGIPDAESAENMHVSSGFETWLTAHYPSHPFLVDDVAYG
ncbi:MAG: hypothetical protein PHQ33_08140, partial [Bacteroidales bacterium]|nr:hypothetical protein [Bacteroidales bacterium]